MIDEGEFLRFWEIAKAYGVTEEEIEEELQNIEKGETWAGFSQMPDLTKGKKSTQDKTKM